MAKKQYDFSGWATRFNVKCADGRTIRDGAFKSQDGQVVPLVYMHDHYDPKNVLGHALLTYAPGQGMRADVKFNNTDEGQHSKEMVRNGDVLSLSIWADSLKEDKHTGEVYHGAIKEVSLVLAGANPEARIDMPFIQHGDGLDGYEAVIFAGPQDLIHEDMEGEGEEMSNTNEEERTVQDVLDEMDEEQQAVVKYLLDEKENEILSALEEEDDEEYEDEEDYDSAEEEDDEMKHNAFDSDTMAGNYLSHDDMKTILSDGKRLGSLRDAVQAHMEDGILAHSTITPIPTEGMVGPSADTSSQTYGIRDMDMLFPDF